MTTAKFLRKADGFRGDARLYELNPPVVWPGFPEHELTHVIVSGVDVLGMDETYIFPANEREILSWVELPGSIRGAIDHRRALEGAGWTVDE